MKATYPCKSCSAVVFCSVACRNSAHFHEVECKVQDFIMSSTVLGKDKFMAFRMLTSIPAASLIEFRDVLKDLHPQESLKYIPTIVRYTTENIRDDDYDLMSSKLSLYKNHDWKNVFRARLGLLYNLFNGSNLLSTEENFSHGFIAVIFMKILLKTNYFHSVDLKKDFFFIGSVLIRFLEVNKFNAYGVNYRLPCIDDYSKYLSSSEVTKLGKHIEVIGSLLNHSCCSGLKGAQLGCLTFSISILPIKSGEEVQLNYGASYAYLTKEQRNDFLNPGFKFNCNCRVSEIKILNSL